MYLYIYPGSDEAAEIDCPSVAVVRGRMKRSAWRVLVLQGESSLCESHMSLISALQTRTRPQTTTQHPAHNAPDNI